MIKSNVKTINVDARNRSFYLGQNITRVVLLITLVLILAGCESVNLGNKKARGQGGIKPAADFYFTKGEFTC